MLIRVAKLTLYNQVTIFVNSDETAFIAHMLKDIKAYTKISLEEVRELAPYIVEVCIPQKVQRSSLSFNTLEILNLIEAKIQKEKEDEAEKRKEERKVQLQYMMLGRLKSDCDCYLEYGNRNNNRLWALDEREQIKEMKKYYKLLSKKPKWLSWDDILEYEKRMI